MWERLEEIERRYEALTAEMARPEVASDYARFTELDKERAALEDVVQLYREYKQVTRQLDDAKAMVEDASDRELRELAREEIETLTARQESLEAAIRTELLPKDPRDDKSVIVEIRAGTGGDEAALFAADLFRMYSRYAE